MYAFLHNFDILLWFVFSELVLYFDTFLHVLIFSVLGKFDSLSNPAFDLQNCFWIFNELLESLADGKWNINTLNFSKHIFRNKNLFSELYGIVFPIFPKKVTLKKNNGCNPRSGKIANVHYQFVAKTPTFFAFSDLILLPEMRKDSAPKKIPWNRLW